MRKVLITISSFERQDASPLEAPKSRGLEYVLNPYGRKLTEEELISFVFQHRPDYIIAGTEKVSAGASDAMRPYVKLISRCGVGMDGIDLQYANQVGIRVMNTPDAPTAARLKGMFKDKYTKSYLKEHPEIKVGEGDIIDEN